MKKSILLTITLLSCTAWMAAQSSSSPTSGTSSGSSGQSAGQSSAGAGSASGQSSTGSDNASGQTGSDASQSSGSMSHGNETSIRGCLNSSGSGYTLTDASGTTYQLQGDTSKLSSHVNNEVEVKGTASGAGSSGAAGSSASAGSTGAAGSQTFMVSKVKKVSSSCSSGGTAK